MTLTLDSTPDDFRSLLARIGTRRAYLVRTGEKAALSASHPELEILARQVSEEPDFDAHEAMFFETGAETATLLSAFLHRTIRGQGAGGVRHWPYATVGNLVRDGLRLSRGMGRKNALAGLYWGGGKGVIARAEGDRHRDPAYRSALYEDYGRFVTSLRGAYVTAEDVGTVPADMAAIFRTSRFVTCVPIAVGGSGNPSPATAKGVVCAMEAALDHLSAGGGRADGAPGESALAGKRVAIQGIGNVGSFMVDELFARRVAHVVATDVDREACEALVRRHGGKPLTIRHVLPGDASIFEEPCDVFAPNALGGVLNPDTIPRLRCRVVCGAANNQLLDDRRDDRALAEREIVYVPDFVANRMGIVSCANEQYGSIPDDPTITRHFGREWSNSVYRITRQILEDAHAGGITTTLSANALADALSLEPHPIFPHRGKEIVGALLRERWTDL